MYRLYKVSTNQLMLITKDYKSILKYIMKCIKYSRRKYLITYHKRPIEVEYLIKLNKLDIERRNKYRSRHRSYEEIRQERREEEYDINNFLKSIDKE